MQTKRLYEGPSRGLIFQSKILATSRWQSKPSIILESSGFYPESGGQLGDRGRLQIGDLTLDVTDSQVDDEGRVHHLVQTDTLIEVGQDAQGVVDTAHRQDMMRQHTGQHLLSATFQQVLGAETVSSRLGAYESTIDLDLEGLSGGRLEAVAERCNAVVMENRPVRALYPDNETLRAMNLRRLPKVQRDIRIIEIEGFDLTPCGGTHCQSTGEVGPVIIQQTARFKGGTRVVFVAGPRALSYASGRIKALEGLGSELGCGTDGVVEKVESLQRELKAAHQLAASYKQHLIQLLCESQHASLGPESPEPKQITYVHNDGDTKFLRALATGLARRADVMALVAGREGDTDDWHIVVCPGKASGTDASAWFRGSGKKPGARGGGRPERAEGRLPSEVNPHDIDIV